MKQKIVVTGMVAVLMVAFAIAPVQQAEANWREDLSSLLEQLVSTLQMWQSSIWDQTEPEPVILPIEPIDIPSDDLPTPDPIIEEDLVSEIDCSVVPATTGPEQLAWEAARGPIIAPPLPPDDVPTPDLSTGEGPEISGVNIDGRTITLNATLYQNFEGQMTICGPMKFGSIDWGAGEPAEVVYGLGCSSATQTIPVSHAYTSTGEYQITLIDEAGLSTTYTVSLN